jgi:uncharacterized protein YegP (UPF0339 family)
LLLIATGVIAAATTILTAAPANALTEKQISSECTDAGGVYATSVDNGVRTSTCSYNDSDGNGHTDVCRMKAGNGEIIAVGEAYESKAAAKNGVESVKKNAADAKVVDLTE